MRISKIKWVLSFAVFMGLSPLSASSPSEWSDQAASQLRQARRSFESTLPQGLGEMAVGSGLVAVIPPFYKSSDSIYKQRDQVEALWASSTTETSKKILETVKTTLRATFPFLVMGAGVMIAADGLVYIASRGRYSLVGSLFGTNQRTAVSNDSNRARYYRSSRRGFQDLLALPESEAVQLMQSDIQLYRLVAFVAALGR